MHEKILVLREDWNLSESIASPVFLKFVPKRSAYDDVKADSITWLKDFCKCWYVYEISHSLLRLHMLMQNKYLNNFTFGGRIWNSSCILQQIRFNDYPSYGLNCWMDLQLRMSLISDDPFYFRWDIQQNSS